MGGTKKRVGKKVERLEGRDKKSREVQNEDRIIRLKHKMVLNGVQKQ